MAGVPQNFEAISNVLANYNFTDIASGTGYIYFYAGKTVDKNLLSNFIFYSDTYVTTQSGDGTIDIDFDVLINRPMDLQGLGIINLPLAVYTSQNTAGMTATPTIYLRKWDGVTETNIVNNVGNTLSRSGLADGTVYGMKAIDLDVPITHFKKGEYLRLTVSILCEFNEVGAGSVSFSYDPMNRTTGWDGTGVVPSKLVFQCPVRLNL